MPCVNCGKRGASTPTGAVHAAQIQTPETTEVRSWTALPLLDVTNVPEDLDLIGGSNKEYKSWRIPASYFLPGGTLNHATYKVATDTSSIIMGDRQVTPVRPSNSLSPWVMAIAQDGETATDLAVAAEDGSLTIMKNGYYTFARPHTYEIGKTYYLSQDDEGEVISTRPSAGIVQPLFSVVDQLTISINVALV